MNRKTVLNQYFVLSYLVLLLNASAYLGQIQYVNSATFFFAGAVYLTYCFIYLVPFSLLVMLLHYFLAWKRLAFFCLRLRLKPDWIVYGWAVFVLGLLQILVFADSMIFGIFDFHLNGFVWNIVTTNGGIASMGGSTSSILSFIGVIGGFFLVQGLMMILLLKVNRFKISCQIFFTKRRFNIALVLLLILGTFQGIAYGLSSFHAYAPILTVPSAFPIYLPITFNRLARSFGFTPKKDPSFKMKVHDINLQYPLKVIQRRSDHKTYNIVWLMIESFRADAIDPQITPATYAFAQRGVYFLQHYSGGNASRMGVFAMFYGLYGNYWFPFLEENRSPLLIDLLIKDNYQMRMFNSATFSSPEFDKTIFARLPRSCLIDTSLIDSGPGWERDRECINRMLDFIERRDPDQPFMTFMFFDATHSRYSFPPENAIRTPYLENFNYATVDLKNDIALIKNRYINACNFVDTQINRVITYLQDHDLLSSTIVLIAGDHGEAFMEKGRWGHNSDFSEEQTRSPLILWIPGIERRQITHITSHLDVPATLLPLLGVTNPPEDYSLGFDLLGAARREFTILASWNTLAYVDNEYKATFPIKAFARQKVTTKYDTEVLDTTAFYQSRQQHLIQIMKDLARFSK